MGPMTGREILDLIVQVRGAVRDGPFSVAASRVSRLIPQEKGREPRDSLSDIDKLVKQVRRRHSDDKGDRSKDFETMYGSVKSEWETKKDAMFETMKELATVQFTLSNYLSTVSATVAKELPRSRTADSLRSA